LLLASAQASQHALRTALTYVKHQPRRSLADWQERRVGATLLQALPRGHAVDEIVGAAVIRKQTVVALGL
jgi:hypothetical protein